MKYSFAIVLMLLLSSCSPEPPLVSVDQAASDPAFYDGKRIDLCGKLLDTVEACAIYGVPGPDIQTVKGPINRIPASVWVSLPQDQCHPKNKIPMGGDHFESFAIVTGTFYNQPAGHLESAKFGISGEKLVLTKNRCQENDA